MNFRNNVLNQEPYDRYSGRHGPKRAAVPLCALPCDGVPAKDGLSGRRRPGFLAAWPSSPEGFLEATLAGSNKKGLLMNEFIASLLEEISRIGRTPSGGSNRLGFSPDDQRVRRLFADRMRECGLEVSADAFGNLTGRLPGLNPDAPAVATGSHLDTVPNGGHYDGVLGCVAGLAALRELAKRPPLPHPVEVIAFQIEESTRFSNSTMGSKILTGRADFEALRKAKDFMGHSLPELLAQVGLDFDKLPTAVRKPGAYKAFIELHIDQGPTLENAGVPLGVVTHIVGAIRARVTFSGAAMHAGATPMTGRRDALLAGAEAALALNSIAVRYAGRHSMVGTTGNLRVSPGAINVIPGEVELACELRGTDLATLREGWKEFETALAGIAATRGTPVTIDITENGVPLPMHPDIQQCLRQHCRERGIPFIDMASGAGHDALNMAHVTPTGMLFVRVRDGLSHHPGEYASPEDIAAGSAVLLDSLADLAERA